MNKAKELLNELQGLDEEIQNRIDELANLEASLLSSPKMNPDFITLFSHNPDYSLAKSGFLDFFFCF